MQLIDMVKLICQSEFAGGHMIKNPTDSLKRLEEECEALKPRTHSCAFEDIGGGLCRLHLDALTPLGVNAATVNRLFVATARCVKGRSEGFIHKLHVLRQCCDSGALPFSSADVDVYINAAKSAKESPLFSHSTAYRDAYHPAYRVVKAAYTDYLDAFIRIDALLDSKDKVTIAIDGGSGNGKTTLARLLAENYGCNILHMDDFFLPLERKTHRRLAQPGGNVDYERFAKEIVAGLKSGEAFSYQPYDCKTGGYKNAVTVSPQPVTIIEGVYSLHPELAQAYDLTLFLKADMKTRLARIKERNGEEMLRRFVRQWIPLENAYFDAFEIEKSCDLVFTSTGETK